MKCGACLRTFLRVAGRIDTGSRLATQARRWSEATLVRQKTRGQRRERRLQ